MAVDAPSALPASRPLPSRSEEIASVLRDEILRGQYRPGERLPSERDLAARFDTGRGTVREAFKKLEQLGIVAIQPGGARVVPIEQCNLDVLGPLLDLDEIPDPALVDQVLQLFGVLIGVAARAAVEKASEADLERAAEIVADMLASGRSSVRQHEALRRLAQLFVEAADHLVLRLMINGLRTSFFERMRSSGMRLTLDADAYHDAASRLQLALERRDADAVGDAMQRLNTMIRDSARKGLIPKRRNQRMAP